MLEEELAFRHALLREGAYAMLTENDRTLGHRLAGEWLGARGEQDARALAEHFEKGGNGPAAGRHYLRVTQQASWGGSALEAAMLARRGLALKLPDELRIRLLGALCELAIWQPDVAASMQHEAEELMQAAPHGSAPWTQGAAARITEAASGGKAEELLAVVRELKQANAAPDALYPMVAALALGTFTLDMTGRFPDGDVLHAELDAIARAPENRSEIVRSFCHLVMASREQRRDDPLMMLEYAKKGQELARQCGHRRMESVGRIFMALAIWSLGASDEVERMLQALPMADSELGLISSLRPFVLAWLHADSGEMGEARVIATHIVTSGRGRGLPLDEARGRWVLAEVLWRAGAFEEAEQEIEGALLLLRRTCPADVPGALATKAAMKLAQGKLVEALAAAEDGLSRQAAMNVHDPFFRGGSFLRLVHAESLIATGRLDEARTALARARARVRLLSIAVKIADPAYRASFFENVPENRRILALAREWLGEGDG
ncbi:hypothetical protein [Sorangium sp. So ce887]|uniref:hypothetical protein n=1 Tax=Sorangium sp. So ce887 TaxID=3133324 RepID=UPI003F5E6242